MTPQLNAEQQSPQSTLIGSLLAKLSLTPTPEILALRAAKKIILSSNPLEWQFETYSHHQCCRISHGSASIVLALGSSGQLRSAAVKTDDLAAELSVTDAKIRSSLEHSLSSIIGKRISQNQMHGENIIELLRLSPLEIKSSQWTKVHQGKYPTFEMEFLDYEIRVGIKEARIPPIPREYGGPGEGPENLMMIDRIANDYSRDQGGSMSMSLALASAGCSYWIADEDFAFVTVYHRRFGQIQRSFGLHLTALAYADDRNAGKNWIRRLYNYLREPKQ